MTKPVVDLVAALEESLAKAKRDSAIRASQRTDDSARIRPSAPFSQPEGDNPAKGDAPPTNGHGEDLRPIRRWIEVVSVSWQDQTDQEHPTTIIEAVLHPVAGGLVLLLEDDEPGHPLVALGRVASINRDRGLIRYDRLTDVVIP